MADAKFTLDLEMTGNYTAETKSLTGAIAKLEAAQNSFYGSAGKVSNALKEQALQTAKQITALEKLNSTGKYTDQIFNLQEGGLKKLVAIIKSANNEIDLMKKAQDLLAQSLSVVNPTTREQIQNIENLVRQYGLSRIEADKFRDAIKQTGVAFAGTKDSMAQVISKLEEMKSDTSVTKDQLKELFNIMDKGKSDTNSLEKAMKGVGDTAKSMANKVQASSRDVNNSFEKMGKAGNSLGGMKQGVGNIADGFSDLTGIGQGAVREVGQIASGIGSVISAGAKINPLIGIVTGLGAAFGAVKLAGLAAGIAVGGFVAKLSFNVLKSAGKLLVDAGKKSLELSLELEKQSRVWTSSLKGTGVSLEDMQQTIKDVALSTPYSVAEVSKAFLQMKNSGVEVKGSTENLATTFKTLSGAALVGGGDISKLTKAYTDVQGAGKIYAQDMRQFINNGVPAWQLLGKAAGATGKDFDKLVATGKITEKQLKSLTKEGGYTQAELQKMGKESKLTGDWVKLLNAALEVEYLDAFNRTTEATTVQLQRFTEQVSYAISGLSQQSILTFNKGLIAMNDEIEKGTDEIETIGGRIASILEDATPKFESLGTYLGSTFIKTVTNIGETLEKTLSNPETIDGLINGLKSAGDFVSTLITHTVKLGGILLEQLAPHIAPFIDGLREVVEKHMPKLEELAGKMGPVFEKLGDYLVDKFDGLLTMIEKIIDHINKLSFQQLTQDSAAMSDQMAKVGDDIVKIGDLQKNLAGSSAFKKMADELGLSNKESFQLSKILGSVYDETGKIDEQKLTSIQSQFNLTDKQVADLVGLLPEAVKGTQALNNSSLKSIISNWDKSQEEVDQIISKTNAAVSATGDLDASSLAKIQKQFGLTDDQLAQVVNETLKAKGAVGNLDGATLNKVKDQIKKIEDAGGSATVKIDQTTGKVKVLDSQKINDKEFDIKAEDKASATVKEVDKMSIKDKFFSIITTYKEQVEAVDSKNNNDKGANSNTNLPLPGAGGTTNHSALLPNGIRFATVPNQFSQSLFQRTSPQGQNVTINAPYIDQAYFNTLLKQVQRRGGI